MTSILQAERRIALSIGRGGPLPPRTAASEPVSSGSPSGQRDPLDGHADSRTPIWTIGVLTVLGLFGTMTIWKYARILDELRREDIDWENAA